MASRLLVVTAKDHDERLLIPFAHVEERPADVVQQMKDLGQKCLSLTPPPRVVYFDEEGDACTLTPETLSDAVCFARQGEQGDALLEVSFVALPGSTAAAAAPSSKSECLRHVAPLLARELSQVVADMGEELLWMLDVLTNLGESPEPEVWKRVAEILATAPQAARRRFVSEARAKAKALGQQLLRGPSGTGRAESLQLLLESALGPEPLPQPQQAPIPLFLKSFGRRKTPPSETREPVAEVKPVEVKPEVKPLEVKAEVRPQPEAVKPAPLVVKTFRRKSSSESFGTSTSSNQPGPKKADDGAAKVMQALEEEKAQTSCLRAALQDSEAERDGLKQQLLLMQNKSQDAAATGNMMMRELERLKNVCEDSRSEAFSWREEAHSLATKCQELEAESMRFKGDAETAESLKLQFEREYECQADRLEDLERKVRLAAAANQELSAHANRLQDAEDLLEHLQEELAREKARSSERVEQLDELTVTCSRLKESNEELLIQTDTSQRRCQELLQERRVAEERELLLEQSLREKSEAEQLSKQAHSSVCMKLAKVHDQLMQANSREELRQAEAQAERSKWRATVTSASPLVLDVDAEEEPKAMGNATDKYLELVQECRASTAFCLGKIHIPAGGAASSAACASFTLRNTGKETWPATASLVLLDGEAFGVPLQHVGSTAPGETSEVILDLVIPPRMDPGTARAAWGVIDAASGARLGPLLVFEAMWDEAMV